MTYAFPLRVTTLTLFFSHHHVPSYLGFLNYNALRKNWQIWESDSPKKKWRYKVYRN